MAPPLRKLMLSEPLGYVRQFPECVLRSPYISSAEERRNAMPGFLDFLTQGCLQWGANRISAVISSTYQVKGAHSTRFEYLIAYHWSSSLGLTCEKCRQLAAPQANTVLFIAGLIDVAIQVPSLFSSPQHEQVAGRLHEFNQVARTRSTPKGGTEFWTAKTCLSCS